MNKKLRVSLFASLLTILIAVNSALAFNSTDVPESDTLNPASKVKGVSPELRDGVFRVVVSTDGTAAFNAFVLSHPSRIIVDFPGLLNAFGAKAIMARGTAVERVRVGQPQAGTVRVVLDLVREVKYTVTREGSAVVISVPDTGGPPNSELIKRVSTDRPAPAAPQAEESGVAVTPRVEIFGGYQFIRTDGPLIDRHNASGWTSAVSTNFNKYLGFTTEISGHWASPGFSEFESLPLPRSGNIPYRAHTVMVGPRFTMRDDPVTTYGHVLFGVGHVKFKKTDLTRFMNLLGAEPNGFSSSSFVAAFGGGVDVRLGPAVSIRAVQADYLLTHFRDLFGVEGYQHSIRVSTGVVFRVGDAR